MGWGVGLVSGGVLDLFWEEEMDTAGGSTPSNKYVWNMVWSEEGMRMPLSTPYSYGSVLDLLWVCHFYI